MFGGFDGVSRREEAAEELTKWLGVVLESESSQVTVHLADSRGALRPASPAESVERPNRPALVDRTVRSGRAGLLRIREPQGWAILTMPLVSAGRTYGVVEIAAPEMRLRERWDTVAAVVTHAAMVIANLQERADLHAEIARFGGQPKVLWCPRPITTSSRRPSISSPPCMMARLSHGCPSANCGRSWSGFGVSPSTSRATRARPGRASSAR